MQRRGGWWSSGKAATSGRAATRWRVVASKKQPAVSALATSATYPFLPTWWRRTRNTREMLGRNNLSSPCFGSSCHLLLLRPSYHRIILPPNSVTASSFEGVFGEKNRHRGGGGSKTSCFSSSAANCTTTTPTHNFHIFLKSLHTSSTYFLFGRPQLRKLTILATKKIARPTAIGIKRNGSSNGKVRCLYIATYTQYNLVIHPYQSHPQHHCTTTI